MRILAAVVEIATLPVFHAGQDLTLRRTVAFELIRDEHPRHIGKAFEQLAEKLLRGVLVAPTLDENVEDVVVLINSPPQIKQVPRSPRWNKLPVKLIDGALLMRHEHLAGALVELSQIANPASCTNRVFHRPPDAFDGIEVVTTVGR